jgi:hypothetical protein
MCIFLYFHCQLKYLDDLSHYWVVLPFLRYIYKSDYNYNNNFFSVKLPPEDDNHEPAFSQHKTSLAIGDHNRSNQDVIIDFSKKRWMLCQVRKIDDITLKSNRLSWKKYAKTA